MEHEGPVRSITRGERVAVDPLPKVDNEKHTGQSQQYHTDKLETFVNKDMKENKGRNDMPSIPPHLTSNGN